VYIRRVTIHNVRGFGEIDLDFTRPDGRLAGWTVLAGRNGAGKSSFLKVLAAAAVGSGEAVALGVSIFHWIKQGTKHGFVEVELDSTHPADTLRLDFRAESVSGEKPATLFLRQPGREPWYLAGYGPSRRLTGSATDQVSGVPEALGRLVTLFREEASLLESVTWLREIYLRRLEKGQPWLKLEKAVLALLNDGLLPDGALVEKIDSEGLWVQQHGARLPLTELSDGYRTTAALVMDMVRTLHQCFGELRVQSTRDEEGDYLRVLHEGVVLIDEVDLHLHVSWQKRIGFWLKRHFPNIQFIVTTHSPFVCQAADLRGLIRLPAPGENRTAEHVSEELYNTVVNGSLDEAVLNDLFGLETPYSQQTEKLRERVGELEARLQAGEATPDEEEEFDRLSARLPQTLPSAVEQALRKLAADV
jgi:energy-coupling factor transporter ATP-binding protein EcfA2